MRAEVTNACAESFHYHPLVPDLRCVAETAALLLTTACTRPQGPFCTHKNTVGVPQVLRVMAAGAGSEAWRLSVRGGGGHDLLVVSPVLTAPASCSAASGAAAAADSMATAVQEVAAAGAARSAEAAGAAGPAEVEAAPIGLVNMMNAGGAVLSAELVGELSWQVS